MVANVNSLPKLVSPSSDPSCICGTSPTGDTNATVHVRWSSSPAEDGELDVTWWGKTVVFRAFACVDCVLPPVGTVAVGADGLVYDCRLLLVLLLETCTLLCSTQSVGICNSLMANNTAVPIETINFRPTS